MVVYLQNILRLKLPKDDSSSQLNLIYSNFFLKLVFCKGIEDIGLM